MRRLSRLVAVALIAGGGWLAYQIWSFRDVRSEQSADAAVVLGAPVWGSDPSPAFEERIRHAVDLYEAGRARRLVFTGGKGAGQRFAQAEVARRYAVDRRVPVEHIFIETRSHGTAENLEQAHRIAEEQGFEDVIVVSDPLHMRRAMAIAEHQGLQAEPSPSPTSHQDDRWAEAWMLAQETYFYGAFLAEQVVRDTLGEEAASVAPRQASF